MKTHIHTNFSVNAVVLAIIVFAGMLLLPSCAKKDIDHENISISATRGSNQLLNADFAAWDTLYTLPQNWKMRQIYQNSDVFTPTNNGVKMESNSEGEHILFQTITVEPNTFYKVSTRIGYVINNYDAGGIYAFDSDNRMLLGKFEKSNSEGEAQFEFLFNSGSADRVNIEIGFLNGMSGSFNCSAVQVRRQDFKPYLAKSSFSDYLNQKMLLSFNADHLDSSVSLLCDYLNSVLQSVIRGDDLLAGELSKLQALLLNRNEYVYLPYYLSVPDSAAIAYCQRAALSLQEIMTNEFNIPNRTVHLQDDTQTGFHQFLEYWNPFRKKWIVIDPYFSFRYRNEDGTYLSAAQLQNETVPWNKIAPFGQHAYGRFIEELQEMWRNKASFEIGPSYQLSYPF